MRKVDARKVGVSPGEIAIAQKMVIPRMKSNDCILDYNCIITRLRC